MSKVDSVYLDFQIEEESDWEFVLDEIADLLKVPETWVRLEGEMGVGKTTFVRHLLKRLGWEGEVPSPSYPILIEYDFEDESALKFIHIDGFRLSKNISDPWDHREWKREIVLVEWTENTHLPLERFNYELKIVAPTIENEADAQKATARRVTFRSL